MYLEICCKFLINLNLFVLGKILIYLVIYKLHVSNFH